MDSCPGHQFLSVSLNEGSSLVLGSSCSGNAGQPGRTISYVPKYSIVVPFHNEEDNVTTLYDRVKHVLEHVGDSFEMVFVDDGSRDRTYRLLEEIAAVDSRVLVVKLRRNFGQTSALAAGYGRRPPARSRRDPQLPRQA